MKDKLINLINDPKNPTNNFIVGKIYEDEGQWSSAVSYYLRAAEFSRESLLAYESLLRINLMLEKQGNRFSSCKAALLRAISLYPKRPEAYFLLAKTYEYTREWHDCYAISCIGESMEFENEEPLNISIGFPGKYFFTFQRAVSAWWIALFDESIGLFRQLDKNPDILPVYSQAIKNNLNNLGKSYKRPIKYEKLLYPELRYKFQGAQDIEKNYSQCYQDMFVLSMLNGKKNGTFIEIGCADPFFNNNTALLEKQYNWSGISIDINPKMIEDFSKQRKSKTLLADALKINYNELLTESSYDYLQLDCEPASTTFEILKRIPLHKVKFAVITFEHDNYVTEYKDIKQNSRNYLKSFGYVLAVNNVAEDNWCDFEDWYVHPDLVDKNIIEKMKSISDKVQRADLYMLGKI
jgi:tetratricopeptide (TPR) repeat protein